MTELETLVHRRLRQLPDPQAPQTLLPRVMAAVRAWSERPWYQRAWVSWPAALQAVSIAALAAVIGGGFLVVQWTERVAAPAIVLWRTLVEPAAPYAFLAVLLLSLTCSLLGGVLNHLVAQEVRES